MLFSIPDLPSCRSCLELSALTLDNTEDCGRWQLRRDAARDLEDSPLKIEALEQQVVALKTMLDAHGGPPGRDSMLSDDDNDPWGNDDYARDQQTQKQLHQLEAQLISAKMQAAEMANQAGLADKYSHDLIKAEQKAIQAKSRADRLQAQLDAEGGGSWFN